jgi:hypothetical protein
MQKELKFVYLLCIGTGRNCFRYLTFPLRCSFGVRCCGVWRSVAGWRCEGRRCLSLSSRVKQSSALCSSETSVIIHPTTQHCIPKEPISLKSFLGDIFSEAPFRQKYLQEIYGIFIFFRKNCIFENSFWIEIFYKSTNIIKRICLSINVYLKNDKILIILAPPFTLKSAAVWTINFIVTRQNGCSGCESTLILYTGPVPLRLAGKYQLRILRGTSSDSVVMHD